MPPEPPIAHYQIRTVRTLPVDRSPCKDYPHSPHGPSAKLLATQNHRLDGSNEKQTRTRNEQDELPTESLLADRPPGARGLSARCTDNGPSLTS
jgi:hypothetical protein